MDASIPYCGLPPSPGAVTWNLDPVLITVLVAGGLLYRAQAARMGEAGPTRAQERFFLSGWLILALALISPLCNLSVALFSARVTQHMIIALIAAPLLVLGRIDQIARAIFSQALHPREVPPPRLIELAIGPLTFAVALWAWHVGTPYETTFRSTAVYWLMHVSLLAAAILLWRVLLSDLWAHPGASLVGSFFTGLQMTFLGVLLTLSPRPWFSVHLTTTTAWGLTPLEDQQLGGLIMWVPAGLLLTLHAVLVFGAVLRRMERSDHAGAVQGRFRSDRVARISERTQ